MRAYAAKTGPRVRYCTLCLAIACSSLGPTTQRHCRRSIDAPTTVDWPTTQLSTARTPSNPRLTASRLGDREHAEHKCRAAKQPADMADMAVLSLHLSLSSTAPPFSPSPLASPSLPLPLPLPCSSSSSSSDESSSGIATLFK